MDYDKVIGNLRAVLLSSKGGVPINEINQDFKTIIGESIPYRRLGYQSLEAFLKSISGIKITNKGGQTYIEALPNEKSYHLSKLVTRQKSKKKSWKGFHHNSIPGRIPRLTKKVVYPGKNVNANSSMLTKNSTKNNASSKQEKIIPLMEVSMGLVPPSDRPRYMQPVSKSSTTPSKKLKDRKSNTFQMIMNGNINKFSNNNLSKSNGNNDRSSLPVITFKPNTTQEHLKASNNEKSSSNISGRLKINSNVPSNSLISNNVPTPQHSELLSPLSPGQLIANKQKSFSTLVPLKILVQETNHKETILKTILVSKEDPRYQLSICTKDFNLPEPIYRISVTAKSPTVIATYAHIKIGSYGYSNYPHDTSSNDEAQQLAAKIAMKDLIDKFGSLSNIMETTNKELIQKRIRQIVNTHMNGVFKDQIPVYYKKEYGERLPIDWFNIVEECCEITSEKGADNSIILQRCEIRTKKACNPISTKSDKISLNLTGSTIPGQLQLPEDQYWIVYVCNIMSTVDVWVRLSGPDYSAIRVCLAGLEDFRDCEEAALFHVDSLLFGQVFYVEVLNQGFDKDGPYATVEFYDTSGQEDVNLNKVLYNQILKDIITPPQIKPGQVTEVFVPHVEKNGDVYVQMRTEGMKYLVRLINRLTQTGLTEDILENSTVKVIDRTKKYLVSVNGNWYRGEVTNIYQNGQVKIFLIDFGTTVVTSKTNLLHLEYVYDLLTKFPAQAIKVHLHNIEKSMFNEKMVSRLRKLVPQNEPILMRVFPHPSVNDIPFVELFKRIQPDNSRKRITSRIATNENDDSMKTLKPPKITGLDDEYFDVHVSMAANPGNFTVQPLEGQRSLEAMMIELQQVCLTYQGLYPTIESIKEGNYYAAKHKDDNWYRVSAMNIINENMVTVYFCDFGDVSILSLDKLQPLQSQFLELPYQAIKAKLIGIRPINMDWSVEDCLRFQKLVLEKNFVSVIIKTIQDDKNPAEITLGLRLIDVETSEDILIDELLVKENRAVFID
ncbi:hypothetical protein M0802_010115 [Mischocyttarus mexicanus]|nr:hypothetical protein M0802_010115 [Mischocyttarus mexicanus]